MSNPNAYPLPLDQVSADQMDLQSITNAVGYLWHRGVNGHMNPREVARSASVAWVSAMLKV